MSLFDIFLQSIKQYLLQSSNLFPKNYQLYKINFFFIFKNLIYTTRTLYFLIKCNRFLSIIGILILAFKYLNLFLRGFNFTRYILELFFILIKYIFLSFGRILIVLDFNRKNFRLVLYIKLLFIYIFIKNSINNKILYLIYK